MQAIPGVKKYRSLKEALQDGLNDVATQHEKTVEQLKAKREGIKWPKGSRDSFAEKTLPAIHTQNG